MQGEASEPSFTRIRESIIMSRMEKKRMTISPERIKWELERAFYSFKTSPLLAIILLQAAAFIIVHAKGAGAIYGDLFGILLVITLFSWFLTSVIHGNQKILIYTLILLTVGTMLQCIMKQEQILKNPETFQKGNPASDLQMQYLVGFAAAIVVAFCYLKWKEISSMKLCRIMTVLAIGLSVLTLILAKSVGNVRNWIHIGGISLQTTEIVKILYVLIGAALLGTTENPSKSRIRTFYVITVILLLLLTMQSEFGTLLLLAMIFLTFVFLWIPDLKIFLKTIGAMGVLILCTAITGVQLEKIAADNAWVAGNGLVRFFLSNYQKISNRFIYWLHPEKDATGLGYQLLKAKESIVLGGWFGTSSVTDLPVKTSDLVYPALIQRCGMIFALLVFIVFILMWLEGMRLFVRKQDRYHQAVGAGFVFMLFDQTLIIIGGSTGLCPLTGITLPFISSGGSSLVVSFMMIGFLLAVSSNVKWKGTENDEKDEFIKEGSNITKCFTYLRHLHDHIPHPDFRIAAGRIRRSRSTEKKGEGTDV